MGTADEGAGGARMAEREEKARRATAFILVEVTSRAISFGGMRVLRKLKVQATREEAKSCEGVCAVVVAWS